MAAYSATRDCRPRFTVPADSITLAESFNLDPDQVLDPESLVPALPGPSGSGRGTATSTSSAGPSSSAANPVDVPATSDASTPTGFTPAQQAWIESLVRSAAPSQNPRPGLQGVVPQAPNLGNIGKC